MNITSYREEIKLKLTGGLLELELDDASIDRLINSVLREVQRYISIVKIITVPFSRCIDLNDLKYHDKEVKISAVTAVYRTGSAGSADDSSVAVDPAYASQWQLLSGTGNMQNFQNYVYNFASWNTLQQIRNTSSTDLAFRYDKSDNLLYINTSLGQPEMITIEYVPRYDDVNEITSDYWIDIILKMSLAMCKIVVGRIRSRYTQSNALWLQDGDTMLSEGNAELSNIREKLERDSNLLYPID